MKLNKKISLIALVLILSNPLNTFALTKTETVYTTLKNTGEVEKTDINVSLSKLTEGEVIDYTNLDNIKNINGEETFSRDTNKITWKSTGKDIYYKGKLNSELPIKVTAKYYLNNEEKPLTEIIGKKGNIKEVFKFKNDSYDYNSGMYTPFVVSTISMINTKNNSNVEVSTGKVINTGNKSIVTAISAPGLYESTNIYELRNMDEVTISYDTDKFSMNDIYFVITPKLLDEVDISNLDKISTVTNSLNTLQDGVNKLESGSNTLYEGNNSLNEGLKSLNEGLEKALNGSDELYKGLSQVEEGSSKINSLTTLVDELYKTYKENEALLNNIKEGITEEQLTEGINTATEEKTSLENKLNEVNTAITMLEQIPQEVITEEQKVTLETLKGQKIQIENGISEYAKGISEAEANLKMLPTASIKLTTSNEVISKVLCGVLGVSDINAVNDEVINTFKIQITTLTTGISKLCEGSKELNTGLNELYEGSNKLVEGSTKLSEGNKELLEGITKLNNEGIKKLSNYGSKINNYSYNIKTLINLSKNYKGFTSSNADKTIFIYKLSK
ncbi:MAG: hypothetical protein IJ097_04210 [Bacilli bacterium]|nr:hypothetical protein [Bacilli bacterium]